MPLPLDETTAHEYMNARFDKGAERLANMLKYHTPKTKIANEFGFDYSWMLRIIKKFERELDGEQANVNKF